MIPLIEDNRVAIEELCRRFHVARLEVFGSAAEGRFDPARSDVDFLIEFHPGQDLGPWLAHYFDFKDALERLLSRPVDLVMPKAMKNPYFIREVNRTRCILYAA
ncbi:MAG: nucleotidyltransferase domain-containing protein [Planctomycetota bacterium]|mgnify:CR=1 FL=1